MAEKTNGFMKAFLPGLVIGLVVGGIAGAVLPELLSESPIHVDPGPGTHTASPRELEIPGPELVEPAEPATPETPIDETGQTPREDGDAPGG